MNVGAIFGVEGLLLKKFENKGPGDGVVFFYACNGYEPLELEKGETVIVEVDSVLAWEESVDYKVKISNIKSAFLGGKG